MGISASKGGSTISQWQPGGAFLTDAVQRLTLAVNYLEKNDYTIRPKYLLWCQGESDGDKGTPKEEYLQGVQSMWEELQKHGLETFFLIGTGNCNMEGAYDRYQNIQAWQRELTASREDVVCAHGNILDKSN